MYFEYLYPELHQQLSGKLSKDVKKGTKLLKKAEKNQNPSEILQANLFLGLIASEQRQYESAISKIESALGGLEENLSTDELVLSHTLLGTIHGFFAKNEDAEKSFKKALKLSEKSENKPLLSLLKVNFGLMYINLKDVGKAEKMINSSLELAQKTGIELIIARSNFVLALHNYEKGDNEQVIKILDTILPIYEENKEKIGQIKSLRLKSIATHKMRQSDSAYSLIDKSIKLASSKKYPNYRFELAWSNNFAADIHLKDKKLLSAEQYINKAKKIFMEESLQLGLADTLVINAKIHVAANRLAEAEPLISDALSIFNEAKIDLEIGDIFEEIGFSLYDSNMKKAEEYLNRASESFKKSAEKDSLPKFLYRKGLFLFGRQDFDNSLDDVKEASELFKKLGNDKFFAFSIKLQSKCFSAKEDDETAEKLLKEALATFEKIDEKTNSAITLKDLAEHKIKINQDKEGIDYYKKALKIFEELNNDSEQLAIKCNLVKLLKKNGKDKEATGLFESIADLAQKTDTSRVEDYLADIYKEYGDILLENGETNKARLNFERGRKLFDKLSDKQGSANLNVRLAMTFFKDNNKEEAVVYLKDAFSQELIFNVSSNYTEMYNGMIEYLKEKEKEPEIIAHLYYNSGLIFENEKKVKEAIESYQIGTLLYVALNNNEKIIECSNKILDLIKPGEDLEAEARANFMLGSVLLKLGSQKVDESIEKIELAKEKYEKLEDNKSVGRCYHIIGNANMIKGSLEEGAKNYFAAIEIFEKEEDVESALDTYDALVDFHFARAKFPEASGFLDTQINHAFKLPDGEQKQNILRKCYAKQVALNIAMNNYSNAIGLINHILERHIFSDPATLERLYVESFCLHHLEGNDKVTWQMLKNNPKPTQPNHLFYFSLGQLYSMFYNRIGQLSIYYHYSGDIYFNNRKWLQAQTAYIKSGKLRCSEVEWLFETSKTEFEAIKRILQSKINNAFVKHQTSMSHRSYSSGVSKLPCLRCLSKGSIEVTLPSGTQTDRCRLCGGSGLNIQS